ncbi:YidC/Oxa1 family membrane protein insertase [Dialister sp.]|uniref:YidC/Oxa1 family membrane protein insertase n=1 Tax=Dialister sp. TaxID=1955814 RepID=UPI002E803290|nr:membrane protein insertase YidC [Dialister sp.]MEE3453771.1 membrane protein insertase YidC [Dialister sp.]
MSDFQIPILSTFVGFLADIMRICLQYAYELTKDLGFPSYGIAIIVLTVIIKTALLPLAVKQIKSMKAMQEIQPKMQEIQKKYKNDPKKLREEMSKLYRDNGASPMSGCLPLLIQMPFLVAIYYALQGFNYDPAHESFLWLESLAVPDSTYILPIISAVSTFIISWQTTPKNAPSNQKTMLLVMPLMIGWMSLNFPSGLVIYWIVVNLYQLVQQTIMFRDEMKDRLGGSKKGTVTVHGDVQAEQTAKQPKKKKVVRKKIIKKVVKKKPADETSDENKEASAEKEVSAEKEQVKKAETAPEAKPEKPAETTEAPEKETPADKPVETEKTADAPEEASDGKTDADTESKGEADKK